MGKLGFLATAGLGAAGGYLAAQKLAGRRGQPAGEIGGVEPVQRLVHVARIRSGSAADLRRLVEEQFPVAAMGVPGLEEIGVFIGSAYLLTEYCFSGEFARVFGAFRAQPAVETYLQALAQSLDDEPAPRLDAPAEQVLTSQALHWDRTGGLTFTPRMRPAQSNG